MTLSTNNEQSNNQIKLPRGYLSYSAMTLWETSPHKFKKDYFEGGPRLDSKYLRFGKSFAKSVEDGTYKDAFPELPVHSEVEFEIRIDINGVPILSFIDSYCPEKNVILEYKTGKHPWTPAKVQKHSQLIFYATALYELTGKMPEYAELVWLETKDSKGEKKVGLYNGDDDLIEFTGNMKTFKRNFFFTEVEHMRERIRKNAIEITNAFKEYVDDVEF